MTYLNLIEMISRAQKSFRKTVKEFRKTVKEFRKAMNRCKLSSQVLEIGLKVSARLGIN